MSAQKLETIRVAKPWGVDTLPPPFGASGERVGEIWFDPPPGCPLLVKYLFTSERLSIQVHPDDPEAKRRGHAAGKEECWYILAAETDARLGIGTRKRLDADELRAAARSGAIEQLMEWHPIEAGMFFHIPAGTVHAIGGGVSLVEIQQNSDITYRLFDYGRPRELHLEDGAAVALSRPMPPEQQQKVDTKRTALLLDSEHLGVMHVIGREPALLGRPRDSAMLVPLEGRLCVDGIIAGAGECLWARDPEAIEASGDARFLAAWFKA